MILNFFVCLVLMASSVWAREPASLGEQLSRDNPKVVAYLKSLGPERKNRPVGGVRLSDGTVELKGYTFLGSKNLSGKKQHFYLFRGEGVYRAYAWVEVGGAPLAIPADKTDASGENAYLLSGDIHTFGELGPGDGLVILAGATPEWLEKQKDATADSGIEWLFPKTRDAPALALKIKEKAVAVVRKSSGPYQPLKRQEFKDYHVPQDAILAAYSWHAGFGDVVHVIRNVGGYEVFRKEMDENETSQYPLKRILAIPLPGAEKKRL